MLTAESLRKKAPLKKKTKARKKIVTAMIDKDLADMMICVCGPAMATLIARAGGDPYKGDYELSGAKVRCQIPNTPAVERMMEESDYKITELAERSIIAYFGGVKC